MSPITLYQVEFVSFYYRPVSMGTPPGAAHLPMGVVDFIRHHCISRPNKPDGARPTYEWFNGYL